VEPACAVLEIPPSAYYAAKKREKSPSARDERDAELKKAITRSRGCSISGLPQLTAYSSLPIALYCNSHETATVGGQTHLRVPEISEARHA
jgi:hypothetical protein